LSSATMGLIKNKSKLLRLVLDAYRKDPSAVEKLIPDAGRLLKAKYQAEAVVPRSFGITERERNQQICLLRTLLTKAEQHELDANGASLALEKCAILIDSGCLPVTVNHAVLLKLVGLALGQSPKTMKKNTEKILSTGNASREVFIIRGVKLALTWDYRAVSLSVYPVTMKERPRLLSLLNLAG